MSREVNDFVSGILIECFVEVSDLIQLGPDYRLYVNALELWSSLA